MTFPYRRISERICQPYRTEEIIMKKILAILIAAVLVLGLATTSFAAVYNGGQLLNDTLSDEEAIYHVSNFDSYDTLKMWAYFDGDQQSQTYTFRDANNQPAYLTYNDEPVKYSGSSTGYKITNNAKYISSMSFSFVPGWFVQNEDGTYSSCNADDANAVQLIGGISISVTPVDFVISQDVTVNGYFYMWDNVAASTEYLNVCYFEIELRNHYVANGDIANAVAMNRNLIIRRYHNRAEDKNEPAYVVKTSQFATVTKALTPITFEYEGLCSIKISDAMIQEGINFKYNQDISNDMIYANPNAKMYALNFMSEQVLQSEATITITDEIAPELGYNTTDSAMPVYLYYSKDGASYTKIGSGDLKNGSPTFTISKGHTLGYLLISDIEITSVASDDNSSSNSGSNTGNSGSDKENTNTGSTNMIGAAVALAVTSLVCAAAVCLKKVSK